MHPELLIILGSVIDLILVMGEKCKLGKFVEKAKEKRRISLICY